MSTNHFSDDDFEQIEAIYNPANSDRKIRKERKPRANPHDRREETNASQVADHLAADEGKGLEAFETTYQPGPFEATWLLSSIRPFYDDTLITDILHVVKGGKEASVYCCAANPNTGHDLLAAKVYRPRELRNLRNDALYREGREYLGEGGKLNENDMREMRAIRNKTGYGASLQHQSWINYEYATLGMLREAGAAVPQPISVSENAILMEYIGEQGRAAPTLSQVSLDRAEAIDLFDAVIHNIHLMLRAGWVHGDLSAYNILYWEGEITLIDFPQVTNIHGNQSARMIMTRDVQRVCEYFIKQGVKCDPRVVADRLWMLYTEAHPQIRAADQSWFQVENEADLD